MDYEQILVAEDGPVATVTLHRPDKLNAYSPLMGAEMRHAVMAFEHREDIRAIVLTGSGRAFCAGADVSKGADTFARLRGDSSPAAASRMDALATDDPRELWEIDTPMIAAVNGAAVGVGLSLALQCDIRVAADTAKLGFPFSRLGMVPDPGSVWMLSRMAGLSRSLELLLTGRLITGSDAAADRVVSRAVPAPEVLREAYTIAHDISTNVAPASAALIKRLTYAVVSEPDRRTAAANHGSVVRWAAQQPDAREGPAAFAAKRPPQWTQSKHPEYSPPADEDDAAAGR